MWNIKFECGLQFRGSVSNYKDILIKVKKRFTKYIPKIIDILCKLKTCKL